MNYTEVAKEYYTRAKYWEQVNVLVTPLLAICSIVEFPVNKLIPVPPEWVPDETASSFWARQQAFLEDLCSKVSNMKNLEGTQKVLLGNYTGTVILSRLEEKATLLLLECSYQLS